jgi:hypothetical protein
LPRRSAIEKLSCTIDSEREKESPVKRETHF